MNVAVEALACVARLPAQERGWVAYELMRFVSTTTLLAEVRHRHYADDDRIVLEECPPTRCSQRGRK